ncbi:MAG: sulfite exporter TauE/SafE family protein [Chitinophagales bacterium]
MEYLFVCIAAFFAGFMDAIVGGGGLVQMPTLLVLFPQLPFASIVGTIKISSISGTSFAAYKYAQEVVFDWKFLLKMVAAAFIGAMSGSYAITFIDNKTIKPVVLFALIAIAIYTYTNKNFGVQKEKNVSQFRQLIIGLFFGLLIGFYDGLIGPGTGTFFILVFVAFLGKDFLHASANAKILNVATNFASLLYLGSTNHIVFKYAIPMACFNVFGSFFGTRLALLKGNKFVRVFFLIVVFGTILRFAYDVFFKH